MYLDFYLLKKAPFHITPDPAFLFLSPSHKAALGVLVYGIEARQGFVALLGEVGLGKTTILRSYLERMDPSQLKPIYILHANLSFRELLNILCQAFGLEGPTDNIAETVNRLHHVLIEEYQQGRNVALLVDEAQHMPLETLEQLRMLSNLETSTQKLLQIILVGQPEFEAKLNDHTLRQLKQRLVIWATLAPLTAEESRDYILYRLAKVSTVDEPIFTKGALQAIIHQAQGTPRVLNILCTNALIQGFGYSQRRISTKIAQEVIAEYTGKKLRRWWHPWGAVAGALVLLGGLFWFAFFSPALWSTISLTSTTPSDTFSFLTRALPPQETPALVHDSGPPVAASAPLPLLEPAPRVALPQTAPVVVRTVQPGDQLAKVARDVYGVSNQAVLAWIKHNNPHLQNVNRIDVGMQLTFPPLPGSRPRQGQGARHYQ
jgi:general secretion pathway protein A